jgi:hypothetical protein
VYQIEQVQPAGFADGRDTVGTLGGTLANDRISNIVLAAGDNGTGYDFAELRTLPRACTQHTVQVFPATVQRLKIRVISLAGCSPLDIDPASLRLGNAPVILFRQGGDVNGDGRPDVAFFFRAADTGLPIGATTVRLTGRFRNGDSFAVDLSIESLVFPEKIRRRR